MTRGTKVNLCVMWSVWNRELVVQSGGLNVADSATSGLWMRLPIRKLQKPPTWPRRARSWAPFTEQTIQSERTARRFHSIPQTTPNLYICMARYSMRSARSLWPMQLSMCGSVPPTVCLRPSNRMTQVPGRLTIFLGLYEQQDPNQVDRNLRGRFITDEEGRYAFYCIRPTPYPVPFDGPAGKLLQLMDRHPYRPAHIHLIVSTAMFCDMPQWLIPGHTGLGRRLQTHYHADLRQEKQVPGQRLRFCGQGFAYRGFCATKGRRQSAVGAPLRHQHGAHQRQGRIWP